ncbi:MAG: nucleotidyltransferase domain-containing protein [Paludibacter sp.]|nr:nucleotidyltransferase domain-containing protein [Paludibacter sp.]
MNKNIINKISNYFSNQPIERAWIFGSYAREEENRKSDIDILVNFSKDAKVTLFKYIHIINDLQAITGKNIDLVEEGQLKPFAKESAEHEKILIYERNQEITNDFYI